MNYQKLHDRLISAALVENGRPRHFKDTKCGFAIHHIQPRCTFVKGTSSSIVNAKDNLVYLTHKAHLIIHHCLTKIYPENKSLKGAYAAMCHMRNGNTRITARQFQIASEFKHQHQRGNQNAKGYRHTDSARQKISLSGIKRGSKRVRGVNGSSEIFLEGAKEITGAGFNHKHVSACCLGKRKSHAGYTWEYI